MKFSLEISTESLEKDIRDRCMEAVAKVLEKDGSYFGVSYEIGNGRKRIVRGESV